MTVLQQNSAVQYIGNGSQDTYDYNFKIFTDSNLYVYVNGVLGVLSVDYNMTNSGTEQGGDVIFISPPADQAIILIERVLTYQQLLDLIPYDRFPAESVESALDYVCMLTQQNEAALHRSITLPPGSDLDLTFPLPGAGEFIKYTNDGTALETSDLTNLGVQVIPSMTDAEVIDGTGTANRLVSASDLTLAVSTHESGQPASVFDVDYIEVVDVLPGTPTATTLYLVRE